MYPIRDPRPSRFRLVRVPVPEDELPTFEAILENRVSVSMPAQELPAGPEVEENRVARLIRKVEGLQQTLDAAKRSRAQKHPRELAQWRVTKTSACPVCRSTTLLRSHRRDNFEMLLTHIMLPFRCDECGTRFFQVNRSETAKA